MRRVLSRRTRHTDAPLGCYFRRSTVHTFHSLLLLAGLVVVVKFRCGKGHPAWLLLSQCCVLLLLPVRGKGTVFLRDCTYFWVMMLFSLLASSSSIEVSVEETKSVGSVQH